MERIPVVSIYWRCAVTSSPAFAHHSRANFDDSREVPLTGTVKQFSWRNPHVYLEIDEHRTVHFNGTRPELADQLPSVVGTSVGRFESKGHLIIETDNFLPTEWGLANGINSSEQKLMTKNYRLADDGMFIDISYTLTDPAYLIEPVTVTGQYRKAESREFMPVACDPVTAKRHLVSD